MSDGIASESVAHASGSYGYDFSAMPPDVFPAQFGLNGLRFADPSTRMLVQV